MNFLIHRPPALHSSLPSPTQPKLPPELVDKLIDYISDELKSTKSYEQSRCLKAVLRSCALVSKLWCRLVRRHIFSSVHVGNSEFFKKRVTTLCHILEHHPELLRHIKSVTITLYMATQVTPAKHYKMVPMPLRAQRLNPWFDRAISTLHIREKYFFRIMKVLAQASIRSLSITAVSGFLEWPSLSQEIRSLLLILRRQPTLTSLSMHNLFAVEASFIFANTIRHLALVLGGLLDEVGIADDTSSSTPHILQCLTALKTLELPSYSQSSLLFPRTFHQVLASLSLINSGNLERLVIAFPKTEALNGCLWAFLLLGSCTLKYFELRNMLAPVPNFPFPGPIQLHRLSALQDLSLKGSDRVDGLALNNGAIDTMINLLKSAKSPTGLRTLVMDLKWEIRPLIEGTEGPLLEEMLVPCGRLLELDTVLTTCNFPELREVRMLLRIRFVYGTVMDCRQKQQFEKRLLGHLRSTLPTIQSSRLIRLDITSAP